MRRRRAFHVTGAREWVKLATELNKTRRSRELAKEAEKRRRRQEAAIWRVALMVALGPCRRTCCPTCGLPNRQVAPAIEALTGMSVDEALQAYQKRANAQKRAEAAAGASDSACV